MTDSEPKPDDIDPTADSAEEAAAEEPAAEEPAAGRSRRVLFGVLAALAFLVPAGAGIAIGTTLLTSSGSADAAPVPTASATTTPTPTEAALPPYDFSSPSGNLRCHIDAESAYCHQGDFTYAVPASNCSARRVPFRSSQASCSASHTEAEVGNVSQAAATGTANTGARSESADSTEISRESRVVASRKINGQTPITPVTAPMIATAAEMIAQVCCHHGFFDAVSSGSGTGTCFTFANSTHSRGSRTTARTCTRE